MWLKMGILGKAGSFFVLDKYPPKTALNHYVSRTFFDTWCVITRKSIFFWQQNCYTLRGYFGRDFLKNDNNSSKPCPIASIFFYNDVLVHWWPCKIFGGFGQPWHILLAKVCFSMRSNRLAKKKHVLSKMFRRNVLFSLFIISPLWVVLTFCL